MKQLIKITLFLLAFITVFLCSCKKTAVDGVSSDAVSSLDFSTVSNVDSDIGNDNVSDQESSVSTPVTEASQVSSMVTAASSSETVQAAPPDSNVTAEEFIVNDPENTRGLSETRYGYSFGAASNGQPHSISINNQLKFDGLQNVEALALDTVSSDKRMYLTFDCGYEYNNITAAILDTLKEKNVKAAFFCTLDYLKKNPSIVRRMIDEGHIVGNHSATHPDFTKLSRTEMAREIYSVHKYLLDNFGYVSEFFRFPTGAYSESALELVTSLGYKSVFWSVAYSDWDTSAQPEHESAFLTVSSRYHSGAVILLHAVSDTNSAILGRLIDLAFAEGYALMTLKDYYN